VAFARTAGVGKRDLVLELLSASAARGADRPDVAGAVDWNRVQELRPRAWILSGGAAPALPMPSADAQARADAVLAGCQGDLGAAAHGWQKQTSPPATERLDPIEAHVLATAWAEAGDARFVEPMASLEGAGLLAESSLSRALYLAHAAGAEEAF